jgi:CRP/FNR family cyclic AMP-dependent transcriptional regulator
MKRIRAHSTRAEFSAFKNALSGEISKFEDKQIIYSQDCPANTLFFIRKGQVMLTIQSKGRRPAVISALGAGDFFGQSCLADVPLRVCTATAIGSCSILAIEKREMNRILRGDGDTSQFFVSYLLSVIRNYQEQMVDLLVSSTEERLAHVLLQLARLCPKGARLPNINQSVLASMVGTTRSRTNYIMTRFRKRGFIGYNGEITVHESLRVMYSSS